MASSHNNIFAHKKYKNKSNNYIVLSTFDENDFLHKTSILFE